MIKIAIVVVLGGLLAGCETLSGVATIFGAGDYFQEAAEYGADVSDKVLTKGAEGYEIYCAKVPDPARDLLRDRFNAKTIEYDMPDICQPDAGPLPEIVIE